MSWQRETQARLQRLVRQLCTAHEVEHRHLVEYRGWAYIDGGKRIVAGPRIRGYVSFAYFAHELAHHLLGHDLGNTSPADELSAWGYARQLFREHGVKWSNGVSAVARDTLANVLKKANVTDPKLKAIRLLENAGL